MYKSSPRKIQWIFTAIQDNPAVIGQKSADGKLITEHIIEYVFMHEFATETDVKLLVKRYICENL